jgi:glucose-6-phosphate dehydrogenase assembly protein OpcA
MFRDLALDVIHTPPRTVMVKAVEDELAALRKEELGRAEGGTPVLRACTLTLVILCDVGEEPEMLDSLVSYIVTSNPARVILIAPVEPEGEASLETHISTYHVRRDGHQRLVGEEIIFYPRGPKQEVLPSAILALRVSGLPFVLYWRGEPNPDDQLFPALVGAADQILFDSAHFTGRAERINKFINDLQVRHPHISFGDINWQRTRTWRELVAQFFDDPANLDYLQNVRCVEIEFSSGGVGNQSQALLLMAWLASALGWRVERGSYRREGGKRFAQLKQGTEPVEVEIMQRDVADCMPGGLTGVRIEAHGDPSAVFEIKRTPGGFADIRETTGQRTLERCATLMIPEESTVISSELDAPRRDRNYNRAQEILQELVGAG